MKTYQTQMFYGAQLHSSNCSGHQVITQRTIAKHVECILMQLMIYVHKVAGNSHAVQVLTSANTHKAEALDFIAVLRRHSITRVRN